MFLPQRPKAGANKSAAQDAQQQARLRPWVEK
jgi:hypothetical protein